jgi:hypothetical protein
MGTALPSSPITDWKSAFNMLFKGSLHEIFEFYFRIDHIRQLIDRRKCVKVRDDFSA